MVQFVKVRPYLGQNTGLVSMVMSTAFNGVWQQALIAKPQAARVAPLLVKLIQSEWKTRCRERKRERERNASEFPQDFAHLALFYSLFTRDFPTLLQTETAL